MAHRRAVSRLKDIVEGLEYLQDHLDFWGITSLAVPPLGCGQRGLDWSVVGPTLYQRLSRLGIPVELYAPHGTPHRELEPRYLQRTLESASSSDITGIATEHRIHPGSVALVAVLERLQEDPHHWPVGKTAVTVGAVVRERYGYSRWWAGLIVEPVELISFVMSHRMLRGSRERAERSGRLPRQPRGSSPRGEPARPCGRLD